MKIETDPSGISIRLLADNWETGQESAAVAEIVGRGSDMATQDRITLPIGVNAPPEHVNLQPGDYTVRIFLPSGDILAESVTVGVESPADDGNVAFDISRSPHEWLSLNSAFGAVQRLPNEERARSLEAWRSTTRANVTESVSRRVDQAISDFHLAYASVQRTAVGVPTGEAWYSTIDPQRPLPGKRLRDSTTVVEWWMGKRSGATVPLQVTHNDDRNAKLSIPGEMGSPDLIDGSRRMFATIRDPRGRLHHAVYPAGWARVSRARAGSVAGAELLMTVVIDSIMRGESDGDDEAAQWRCAPAVFDVEAMTYLGFLHSGQARAAEAMLEQASELLFEKQVNPVAAAAGAFGLLAFSSTSGSRRTSWRGWIRNLYSMYPHLPDGAIAMAQLYLRQGEGESGEDELDIERLRGFALEATRRGVPYLTYGIRLLSEIFTLVTSDDQQQERSGDRVERTVQARRMVRELERLVVPSAFFTVLESGEAPS